VLNEEESKTAHDLISQRRDAIVYQLTPTFTSPRYSYRTDTDIDTSTSAFHESHVVDDGVG
jgi:hypothetical protein